MSFIFLLLSCHNLTFVGGKRSNRLERRRGECIFTQVYSSGDCSQSWHKAVLSIPDCNKSTLL